MTFINSCLQIYFDYEYVAFSTICKEQFMKDFASRRRRYCCEALVNAIVARVCQMQWTGSVADKIQANHFYTKAETLLELEEELMETPFPLTQAISILVVVNCNNGSVQRAWTQTIDSVKSVILDMEQHTDHPYDDEYHEVRATTFCGIFTLAWYRIFPISLYAVPSSSYG
jgi:hypothetical protein